MRNSAKHLHIISFNIPYPADYGGVIDVFYKIKALAEAGIKVHLHCYKYGRDESAVLEKLCYKVHYYKRRIYRDPLFVKLPYIVATRNSSELLANLLKDDHPILFEGMHCCYYLAHEALKDRFKIVRMHNIEHVYYKNLAKIEKNVFKKYFFSIEAERLKKFESVLEHANAVAAISPDDEKLLSLRYDNVFYLPVFHGNKIVADNLGLGDFALYHGNLGVGENNEAALYLVREIFSKTDYPLIIAGMNPTKELQKAVEEYRHIKLQSKLTTQDINRLIRNAQINILPTFQSTGMKLKLINVLYHGRHILVNSKMVKNTGLEHLCKIADSPQKMRDAVQKLSYKIYTTEMISTRRNYLKEYFDTKASAQKLIEMAYSTQLV